MEGMYIKFSDITCNEAAKLATQVIRAGNSLEVGQTKGFLKGLSKDLFATGYDLKNCSDAQFALIGHNSLKSILSDNPIFTGHLKDSEQVYQFGLVLAVTQLRNELEF
jgi:hypothetical protein